MTRPTTWEVVRYVDGTGAVSEFDRTGNGQPIYVGRVFVTAEGMATIVAAIAAATTGDADREEDQ